MPRGPRKPPTYHCLVDYGMLMTTNTYIMCFRHVWKYAYLYIFKSLGPLLGMLRMALLDPLLSLHLGSVSTPLDASVPEEPSFGKGQGAARHKAMVGQRETGRTLMFYI